MRITDVSLQYEQPSTIQFKWVQIYNANVSIKPVYMDADLRNNVYLKRKWHLIGMLVLLGVRWIDSVLAHKNQSFTPTHIADL